MDITVIERVVPAMSVEDQNVAETNGKSSPPVIVDVSTEIGVTQWIKSLPKLIQEKLLRIIHSSARPEVVQEIVANEKRFAPWRKITIGCTTARGFIRKFQLEEKVVAKGKGVILRISYWAKEALYTRSFKTSLKRKRVSLLLLSHLDLGLEEKSTVGDLLDSIEPKRLVAWSEENLNGWRLLPCPAEVAPHLRFQYRKQPMEESILVAMKPIVLSDGDAVMFAVEHGKHEDPSLHVASVRLKHKKLPAHFKILLVLERKRRRDKSIKDTPPVITAEQASVVPLNDDAIQQS